MDLGAVLLLLSVTVLVAAFVGFPLTKGWRLRASRGQKLSTLLAERDHVLNEIQELDFDNTLGKLAADEYSTQRNTLLQRGAEVLREIDALANAAGGRSKSAEALEEETGDAAQREAGTNAITDDDLEIMIANRRTARKGKAAGFCPRCGKPLLESDFFCACCGEPVQVRAQGNAT